MWIVDRELALESGSPGFKFCLWPIWAMSSWESHLTSQFPRWFSETTNEGRVANLYTENEFPLWWNPKSETKALSTFWCLGEWGVGSRSELNVFRCSLSLVSSEPFHTISSSVIPRTGFTNGMGAVFLCLFMFHGYQPNAQAVHLPPITLAMWPAHFFSWTSVSLIQHVLIQKSSLWICCSLMTPHY